MTVWKETTDVHLSEAVSYPGPPIPLLEPPPVYMSGALYSHSPRTSRRDRSRVSCLPVKGIITTRVCPKGPERDKRHETERKVRLPSTVLRHWGRSHCRGCLPGPSQVRLWRLTRTGSPSVPTPESVPLNFSCVRRSPVWGYVLFVFCLFPVTPVGEGLL